MTHRDWKTAWEIFQRAGELSGVERESYLGLAFAQHPGVREEVLSMLAEDAGSGDGTEERIGPYRVIRTIAEGGMGTVFLAEQEKPLKRKVALKQIRRGLQSGEVLARFNIERQALAMLDHPNIAHVFDSGTTEKGNPYFVMEYVDGLAIHRYCQQKGLGVAEKLRLVQQVCDGVQHAHSKGIIHRDIKPANVLVTEVDGKPVPRIIDFGVARATGVEETMATSFGAVVGTLRYMSPEQAIRSPDIDVRTDVYSIGILLYELLTGKTPIDGDSLSLPEMLQGIAEAEAVAPSRMGAVVEPEVDWIVMRAIEKDPARRYQTANALGLDIQKYLDGEAVDAGPPSRSYRLAKMARRYRAWLVTAAVFVLVLSGATVVSIREALRAGRAEQETVRERDRALAAEKDARAERDRALVAEAQMAEQQALTFAEKGRADSEAATARAVADFLKNDLLAQASPNVQAGPARVADPNLSVRTILDRSAASLAGKFEAQPAVRQSLEHTIAATYLDLGAYAQAREHAEQAIAIRTQTLGKFHAETLASMHLLAIAYRSEGKYPEAEKLWSEMYEYQRKALGAANPGTLMSMHSLAALYRSMGRHKESTALYEKVLPLRRRVLGADHVETLRTANNLGYAYLFTKQSEEAEVLLSETLQIRKRVLGAEHPDTLISMNNLAIAYKNLGRGGDGLKLLEEALEIQRRTMGRNHTSTLSTVLNLGMALREMKKLPEAQKVYEQGMDEFLAGGNEKDQTAITAWNNLGNVYVDRGLFDKAVVSFERSLALRRATVGNDHPETVRTVLNLAGAYRRMKRFQEAEVLTVQAVESRKKTLGPTDGNTLVAMGRLADIEMDLGKYREAAEVAREVWEVRRRVLGEGHADTLAAKAMLERAEGKL